MNKNILLMKNLYSIKENSMENRYGLGFIGSQSFASKHG